VGSRLAQLRDGSRRDFIAAGVNELGGVRLCCFPLFPLVFLILFICPCRCEDYHCDFGRGQRRKIQWAIKAFSEGGGKDEEEDRRLANK
jgi:hypothetical protein